MMLVYIWWLMRDELRGDDVIAFHTLLSCNSLQKSKMLHTAHGHVVNLWKIAVYYHG
jgi:hypothetical protein